MKDFHNFGLNLAKTSEIRRKFWTSLNPSGENINIVVTFFTPENGTVVSLVTSLQNAILFQTGKIMPI